MQETPSFTQAKSREGEASPPMHVNKRRLVQAVTLCVIYVVRATYYIYIHYSWEDWIILAYK